MKRQIFFVLLAMLTTALGGMKAQPVEISDAAGLVAFANRVNNGEGGLDAVLTADIDMSGITDFPGIGNDGSNLKRYHATFDGRGHRIKNLHMTGADIALFPVTSDNTIIKNLIIDASCSFKGTGRVAAFVSACNWDEWGSRKVEFYNCGNEAEVEGTANNCGGLLGCNYDGDIAIVMKNCFNAGHIKGAGECGALSGWIGTQDANSISYCYNIAEVEGLDGGNTNNLFRGHVGVWNLPNNNCYDTHYSHNTGSVFDASKVTSGELCWMLNQGQSDVQWVQTIGTDGHPLPGAVGSLPVYRNGTFNCDGSLKSGSITYGNTDENTTDPHVFGSDDLCTVCHAAGRQPELVAGVYQIGSIGHLVWFADAVNSGHVDYNAVLTRSISQGVAVYTPIGNIYNPYRGTFDGQKHSITMDLNNPGYDNQGVFGVITDGVHISNLIVRGTIRGDRYVGGIAGSTLGGSQNALSTLIENCGNEAHVVASNMNAGAIIGCNMGGMASFLIKNCYNIGAIEGPNDTGALSGWSGGGWSEYINCYNAGTVNGGGAADFSRHSGTRLTNCYHLDGCNNTSQGTTVVTTAQMNNGALRDNLNSHDGTHWYQYNSDTYPLPFDHPHADPGTYYLYNVGSGQWLCAGNSWGTHASVTDKGGMDVVLETQGTKYRLRTNMGGNTALNNDGWMDSGETDKAFTFISVVTGSSVAFQIKSDPGKYLTWQTGGTNVVFADAEDGNNSLWILVTKAEREAALAAATEDNPVDATFYLTGTDFGRNDATRNQSWDGDDPGTGGYEDSGNVNYVGEHFNKTYDMYQTVTVPNGYYKLQVQGYYREGDFAVAAPKYLDGTESLNALYYANSVEMPLMSIFDGAGKNNEGSTVEGLTGGYAGRFPNGMNQAGNFFKDGRYWNVPIIVHVTDGTLRVGLKKTVAVTNDWTCFDNFRLDYLGTAEPKVKSWVKLKNARPFTHTTGWEVSVAPTNFDAGNSCAEYWQQSAATLKQTVRNLPAGYYTLTATAFTRAGLDAQLQADAHTAPLVQVASGEVNSRGNANTWFNAGNGLSNLTFRVTSDGEDVTIGIKSSTGGDKWTVWRGFELKYLGEDPSWMTAEEKLVASSPIYLYNPYTDKFLSRGDDYGLRTVVDDYGIPFNLVPGENGYKLQSYENPNNHIGDDTWSYTDCGGGRIREFELTNNGDYYTLKNLGLTNGDENFLYVYLGEDANKYCVANNSILGVNYDNVGQVRWQLLTQAERDAILRQKTDNEAKTAAQAAKLSASSEAALKSVLSDLFTPEDKTSAVSSASLRTTTEGWTTKANSNCVIALTTNANGTEVFQDANANDVNLRKAGSINQTVTGLEAGLYKVSLHAFYRMGTRENSWDAEKVNGLDRFSNAYLSANGRQVQIASWASEATGRTGEPNSMATAEAAFAGGGYLNEVYTYVGNDGKLDLSIALPGRTDSGWFMMNDLTLTYYRPKLDVTEVTREDINLSFETGNTTNWTKNNSSVSGQTEVRNDNMFPGKDGDYYFNTWDDSNQGTEKTLWLRHNNFMMPGDPGTFMMTADIAGYWDSEVVVQVRDGSDNVLGTVTHRLDADPNDGNWGANTPTRERVYFTLPAKNSYISIYVYNTTTGTAFFKADNFRFYRVNGSISDGLLPNPSFELADASGTAETARTISNLSGTGTIPGTGETLYGWTLPTMQGTTTGTGQNSNNRIGLGSASTLDVYSYVTEDNLNGIPTPDDGDIYFYNGQNMRNSGGEQVYTLSTQTTTSLPVGLYSLSLRYKGMGAYQTAWPKTGDSNLTLNVEIGGTELAAATSANFPYYDRNEGVARGNRNKYLAQQPWQTLNLIFYVETPGVATINIKEQFCQAYSTDIILDNVQLKAYAVPKPPVHKATTNTASYTLYGAAENECYLMNAATGLFLGGGNASGTQASLVEHGIPFNIVKPGSAQRIYRLSSPAYEGNKNSLNGTYIDGSPTYFYIDYVADGRYTLSTADGSAYLTVKGGDASQPIVDNTGTSGTSLLNQWYIIKKADRELNLLEETTDGDASFYIPNASFSRNQNTDSNKNTWTETHASDMKLSDVTNVAESYHSTFEVKKTVSVPNGTYRFRAQGFYRQDGTDDTHLPYFFVSTPGGAEVTSTFVRRTDNVAGSGGGMAESSRAFLNGKYYSDYVTVRVTDNLLTVGCRLEYNSNLWCCWDNFELQMLTHDEATGDIDEVNTYITTMEAAQGFQPGEYATYAVTEAKAIQEAVDAGFPYSYDKVAAYLAATYPANADDVNAFYRPDFAYYRNAHIAGSDRAAATGWSNTNMANTGVVGLQFNEPANPGDGTTNPGLGGLTSKKALYLRDGNETVYGSVAGYTMPLLYGTQYRLAFKYGGWGGTGTVTATIKDGSGNVVQTWTLTTTGTANSSTDAWQDFDETFSTTDAGNYTLTLTATGAQAAVSDFSLLPCKETNIDVATAPYYFYNDAEGQYLMSGGAPAGWGTQAVLGDDGIDITLAQSGTGYTLDTRVNNGGANHFLNPDNLYCDNAAYAFTFIPTGGANQYYLRSSYGYVASSGHGLSAGLVNVPSPTEAAKWTLKTRADRIAELESMTADGTTTMDATFLIPGANFGRNDQRVMTNWNATANRTPDGDIALNGNNWFHWGAPNNDPGSANNWYYSNFCVQAYHMKTFEVSQTIEGVPAGVYTLSAQGFYSGEAADLPYFFIQDATVEGEGVLAVDYSQYLHQEQTMVEMGTGNVGNVGNMFNAGRYFYRDGKFWNNLPSVRVCGNKLKLGAKQDGTVQDALWTVFDNFRLTYRPFVDADLEPEADLAAEYQSVNVGDDPFEIPADDPYYTMLTAAQNDAATATTNTQRAVALIELLKADDDYVNFARLNAFKTASSTKFTLGNGQYPGMVLTVKGGKGATGDAITMGFTDAAGSIYPQGLTFTPVAGNTNCFRLSYTDGDGQTVYLCTGDAALGNGRNDQIRTTTIVGDALLFRIIPQTTGDGVWYLKNTAADTRMGLNDTGFYTGTGTAGANAFNFSFAEAQMAPAVTLNVKSENQFSTLMLPFEADCPEGVLACKVDDIDGNNIGLETFDKFEANVPYIVYAENGFSGSLQNYGAAFTDETITGNHLTGTATTDATVSIPVGCYVLSAKTYTTGRKVGFYRVTTDNVKLPKNRAYFSIGSSAGVKEAYFFGDGDDETGLSDLVSGEKEVEGIYDLRGVRQPRMQKGVNIIRFTDGTTRKVQIK
ncbi:MAG: hypothetical protein IJ614_06095 [Prevotella sp.]|nr:hypothetical protein [Bacteroidaceae bacterium]MBR1505662.1 hypothetical protein [Prevotella sp.]